MSQLGLPLDWRETQVEPVPFIIADANRLAVRHLDHPAHWPVRTSLLVGPRKSGRSLLGRSFAQRGHHVLLDDADRMDEESLFHAWNRAQSEGVHQLMIAETPPPLWQIGLADLASRMAATPVIRIDQPDDRLALDIITAHLERTGVPVDLDVRAYLSPRIERDYVMVDRFIDAVLTQGAGRRQRLTIPQARAALELLGVA